MLITASPNFRASLGVCFNKNKTIRRADFLPTPGNLDSSFTASSINDDG
jgi:hypothetical protein